VGVGHEDQCVGVRVGYVVCVGECKLVKRTEEMANLNLVTVGMSPEVEDVMQS
jgi:hypothetical protein